MNIENIKEYILENDKIQLILENLGCHHIKINNEYVSCANPDGDNTKAILVYLNTNLTTINYTREICKNGSIYSDIFTLVEFITGNSFFKSVKIVCEWLGFDYHHNFNDNQNNTSTLLNVVDSLISSRNVDHEPIKNKTRSEVLLAYYLDVYNDLFANDGISYKTQDIFEIGYDEETNRITIPIRDEVGDLVGVKGRYFAEQIPEYEEKYLYIEKCARSQILYGYHLTENYIKEAGKVFVAEAEKGTMQLFDMGFKNSVSTGGKKISKTQIIYLSRLCVDIIFCFDKDVTKEEITNIANRFDDSAVIYAIIDDQNILDKKESPTDNSNKFKILLENNLYRIK